MDYDSDFKLAAAEDLTCYDCKYCQNNMKVLNVRGGYLCMREDSKQSALHGSTWMNVSKDFLCNKFELDEYSEHREYFN